MEYEFFYKRKYDVKNGFISSKVPLQQYDIFISAYNKSERVNFVLGETQAVEKHIFILKEYCLTSDEISHLPSEYKIFSCESRDESDIFLDYFKNNLETDKEKKILFDITGFHRPHIIFFVRLCKLFNIKNIDFIYSEPLSYKKNEDTTFSKKFSHIRDVKGCSGSHQVDVSNDYLIIGSGYDYSLILNIAKEKKQAKKIQILGFPSLQADMFQQNVLKAYQAEEEISSKIELDSDEVILAPANDPFVTASLLSKIVNKLNNVKPITNLYLCPLSTKSQTLGMALYYVNECIEKNVSIIFPFCEEYENETSDGISRFWLYSVEFD